MTSGPGGRSDHVRHSDGAASRQRNRRRSTSRLHRESRVLTRGAVGRTVVAFTSGHTAFVQAFLVRAGDVGPFAGRALASKVRSPALLRTTGGAAGAAQGLAKHAANGLFILGRHTSGGATPR